MATVQEFIDEIIYEVDDLTMTRFTTQAYHIGIREAVRAVKREAEMVNPDFVQYRLGPKRETYRAIPEIMRSGAVAVPADTGTAEDIAGGSTNELLDETKEWVPDEWKDYTLALTGGTGSGQSKTIISNTYSTVKISGTWAIEPDSTTTYTISSPADVLYDSAMTTPYAQEQWEGSYVRITGGTAIGQERKVETMKGYEIVVEEDWDTALVNADAYEVVGIKRDFTLPSDFRSPMHVEVDATEINPWNPNTEYLSKDEPNYSFVGSYLRVRGLGGGEIVELIYAPSPATALSTTSPVEFGDDFFDSIKYYVSMKFKGWNKEDLANDVKFSQPIHDAMLKRMTDMNVDSPLAITSEWEHFKG